MVVPRSLSYLIPRVRRYLEDNNFKGYVDVGQMADILQDQYLDDRRKPKLLYRKNVQIGCLGVVLR